MLISAISIGAVVIGRNEGDRLRRCLRSVCEALPMVVYVDSASTDDSVEFAHSMGVQVIELERSKPFTAARARNEGAWHLLKEHPELEFIQFVDGDCELVESWADEALAFFTRVSKVAVVCGRRRELFPERSKYNRLCDLEWDTPIGFTRSCGGDSLVRAAAFREVGGFCEHLIAAEDDDLCFRLRQAGWLIYRLDADMTWHDADITTFSQWWKRSVRSGYAAAEAFHRRGDHEPGLGRRVISNLFWGLPITWPLWPILWLRLFETKGALYASYICVGKLPHSIGQLKYAWRKLRRLSGQIIEYK